MIAAEPTQLVLDEMVVIVFHVEARRQGFEVPVPRSVRADDDREIDRVFFLIQRMIVRSTVGAPRARSLVRDEDQQGANGILTGPKRWPAPC